MSDHRGSREPELLTITAASSTAPPTSAAGSTPSRARSQATGNRQRAGRSPARTAIHRTLWIHQTTTAGGKLAHEMSE